MMKNFGINFKVSALLMGAACFSVSACSDDTSWKDSETVADEPSVASPVVDSLESVSIDDTYSLNYGYPPYEVDPVTGNQIRPEDKNLRVPTSIVVCRSKKCAPALSNMSSEFLYNAYYNLLENNVGTNVMLCTADSTSHVCYEPFINFNVNAGISPATVVIDSMRIIDLGMIRGNQAMTPVIDYSVYTNGIKTKCTPSVALARVKSPNYMIIDGMDSECSFTSTGKSVMSLVFTVDYIDFDYGIIGASYSVGSSGTTSGGGKGYALLRFKNPVTGDVVKETCDKDKNACERKFDAKSPNNKFVTRCDGKVSSVYPYISCSAKSKDKAAVKEDKVAPIPAPAAEPAPTPAPIPARTSAVVVEESVAPSTVATYRTDTNVVYRQSVPAPERYEADKGAVGGWTEEEKTTIRMRSAAPLDYDTAPGVDGPKFYKEGRLIIYDDFARREPSNMVIVSPAPRN